VPTDSGHPGRGLRSKKGGLTIHSVKIEDLAIAVELDPKAIAAIWGGTSSQAAPHATMSGSFTGIGASAVLTADAPKAPSETVSFNYGGLQVVYKQQSPD
jgi:hypothetical protein